MPALPYSAPARPRNALFNADECLDNDDSFIAPAAATDRGRRATTQPDRLCMNSDNGSLDQNSKPIIYNNAEAVRGGHGASAAPELNRTDYRRSKHSS